MSRREIVVRWSTTPEGHLTTQAPPWRYTVLRCTSGWVWVRAPVYERLTPEIEITDALSQETAVRAIEEIIQGRAWTQLAAIDTGEGHQDPRRTPSR